MRIILEIDFPDDFLVAELPPHERNRVLARRLQNAFDHEYPLAPMETVRITWIESHRDLETIAPAAGADEVHDILRENGER